MLIKKEFEIDATKFFKGDPKIINTIDEYLSIMQTEN